MVQIDLTPLKEGVHQLTLEPEAEELDLDPTLFRDIAVNARVDYRNDRALVNLDASATATLECDRTLVLFDQHIDGSYTLLFVPTGASEEMAGREEDVREFDPTDRKLDITDTVRDTLVLAVPTRKIAPGAEEVDIPTRFGASTGEDAIDPRWEALRGLRGSDEES